MKRQKLYRTMITILNLVKDITLKMVKNIIENNNIALRTKGSFQRASLWHNYSALNQFHEKYTYVFYKNSGIVVPAFVETTADKGGAVPDEALLCPT